MEKRILKIIDNETDSHEYDVKVKESKKGKKFTLKRSSNTAWTNPGAKIMSILDHGNGLDLDFSANKLEYDTAQELRLLLNVIERWQSDVEYRVVEEEQTKLLI